MHGWDFFLEYKELPIADNKTDEKQIRLAIKLVESTKEKKEAEKLPKAPSRGFSMAPEFSLN